MGIVHIFEKLATNVVLHQNCLPVNVNFCGQAFFFWILLCSMKFRHLYYSDSVCWAHCRSLSPPPFTSSDPRANECRMVELRGKKIASFRINVSFKKKFLSCSSETILKTFPTHHKAWMDSWTPPLFPVKFLNGLWSLTSLTLTLRATMECAFFFIWDSSHVLKSGIPRLFCNKKVGQQCYAVCYIPCSFRVISKQFTQYRSPFYFLS